MKHFDVDVYNVCMEPTHITSIASPTLSEHKAKGSRFLGYAYPLSQADDLKPLLQKLYDEHPKAVHWCYAYRLGSDGMQFRANDDGEPSGSAGMPILRQIDSAGLSDVVVIVVRYFGGTLLGVPGLIQAYKQATVLALQDAIRVEKPILKTVSLRFSYEKMSEVMRLIKRTEAQMLHQEMEMEVSLSVAVPKSHEEAFMQQVQDWHWLQWEA
ncbi:hypothetical protein ADP71_29990 [Vitreoscilla sp. C1]|uniref:IMPACT family protein n=1 Tax=Vitreoscilla sp. (strain C1) TaxID=96942 RepID=UPI001599C92F|nr:YigZ family protein [Vitreoscilla sp. C1]AUZ06199.2 hypothetical protein ADP71_29990 [Vitreoscilla sp. C1]